MARRASAHTCIDMLDTGIAVVLRHFVSDFCGVPDQVFDEGSAFLMRVSHVLGSLGMLARACHYDTEDEDRHFTVVCFARSMRLTIDGYSRENYIGIDLIMANGRINTLGPQELIDALVKELQPAHVNTQEIIRVCDASRVM